MSNKVPKKAPTMRAKAAEKAEAQRAAQAAAESKRRKSFIILGAVVGVVILVSVVTALVLSSSKDSSSSGPTPGPTMQKYSCQACHAVTTDPGPGQENAPTWAGLYGSQVELQDGTTVTADDAYLTKAIEDPSAQIVAGYPAVMPENNVPPADVKKLIAEIEALQDQG